MKVNAKQLDYSFLPSSKNKKKLMKAGDGFPIDPRIKKGLSNLPDNYFSMFEKWDPSQLSPVKQPGVDANVTAPNPMDHLANLNGVAGPQPHQSPKYNGEIGKGLLLGEATFDAMLPYGQIHKQQVVQPQAGYNPYPYGTGSQALYTGGQIMSNERENPIVIPEGAFGGMPTAKSGNWIQKAVNPKHKGYCTPMTKKTCTPKRKALAKTFKKHHGFHEDGGIISDPMSVFSPQQYEQGGLVPQPNPLEQWIQYPDGGAVAGPGPIDPTGTPLQGTTPQPFAGSDHWNKQADLSDLISYNISGMGKDKDYRSGLINEATRMYGPEKAHKLYNAIGAYNQRSDRGNYKGEDAINNFYSINDPDKDIQDIKSQYKTFGGSPNSLLQHSPFIKGTNKQGGFDYISKMQDGGVMYNDGGNVNTMWGGDVDKISHNPYDDGTVQFNGASHDDGGIGMHYNGKQVEVEGGETATKDSEGNLNIMGNMYLPGTNKKFKTVSKEIADKEKRYDFLKTKGTTLTNTADVGNKYERLSFNAGKVMMEGGDIGQQAMAATKQKLSDLQKAMLETADEHGIDPQAMSKGKVKMRKGGQITTAADGQSVDDGGDDPNDKGRSTRNKNPGNIKYGKFAQSHGATGKDKDGFAIFPDNNTGRNAMQGLLRSKGYNNQNIDDAIGKWTAGSPYKYNLPGELQGKKVSDLDEGGLNKLMDIMTKGEDSRYGVTKKNLSNVPTQKQNIPPAQPFTPYGLPNVNITPDQVQQTNPQTVTPPDDKLNLPGQRPTLPTNAKPLQFDEIAGEVFGAATNRQVPVASQKYQPELYSPYQVSFQDRLNNNQSTFNAISRQVGGYNPTALSSLAGQKYGADSAVKSDEFRTNQGISNDITNKNIGIENDAQLKNLSLADTQYTRQSQAQSKTKELNQMIVNSLSSKYAQNQLEQNRLKAYENLYDYRFVPNDKGGNTATYMGPDASFSYTNRPNPYGQQGQGSKSAVRYDGYGNVKSVTDYSEDELRNYHTELENEALRRNMKFLTVPPLQ